mmetsp:Transcript_28529/g.60473  ORF Transcript_28529/g.60473 Transcript_28529/m.60473 type:complete len:106 (-) Transcript_28529:341-658(-)
MLIKRKRNQLKPELNHNQKMKFLFLKKLTALALAATSGANALDGKYVLRGSAGIRFISIFRLLPALFCLVFSHPRHSSPCVSRYLFAERRHLDGIEHVWPSLLQR